MFICFLIGCNYIPEIETTEAVYNYDLVTQNPISVAQQIRHDRLRIIYNAEIKGVREKCNVHTVHREHFSACDYEKQMAVVNPDSPWYLIETQENMFSEKNIENHIPFSFPNQGIFIALSINEKKELSLFSGDVGGNTIQYKRNANAIVVREENIEDNDPMAEDFERIPTVTREDAFCIAYNTIESLHIDPHIVLLYSNKAIAYTEDGPISYGWEFVFSRQSDELAAPYIDYCNTWKNSDPPVNFAPWSKECCFLFVDDDGLFRLDIRGAGRDTGVLEKDVQLLPFIQIKEKIDDQLIAQHAIESPQTVYVWKIDLRCCVINYNSQTEYGVCIPCWMIRYYLCDGDQYSANEKSELTLFIDAINGNYIEPRATEDMIY